MSFTLRSLLADTGLRADIRGDAPVAGLAYDSRQVNSGDLFCCIPGAWADGHDFARAAVDAGAAAVLCERDVPVDVPRARVADVRAALGPLAATFFSRPSEAMRVAGVTGTNGKTTVTHLLEQIGAAADLRTGVLGTVGYRVGGETMPAARTTPEAIDLQRLLARMRDAGVGLVAMEVASHGLDMRRVDGTRFACTAFTNLSQDHLDYHGTLEAYFEAKARLFDLSFTRRAVVNVGDTHGRKIVQRATDLEVLTYGSPQADLVCEDVWMEATGTRAIVVTPAGRLEVSTPLVGPYNLDNVLCALGCGLLLELPEDALIGGIAALDNVPGRLERIDAEEGFTVLVDYAHTPDALERALEAVRSLARGRVIVVFGCGGDRDRAKRPIMGEVSTRVADLAILTSDNPRSEEPTQIIEEIVTGAERGGGEYRVVPDRREAIGEALQSARAGDVVLVAGKGHESGQTFADRTIPFDDRTVVRELLEETVCRS